MRGVVRKPDIVVVTGTGTVRAIPDLAVLSLGVEVRHAGLQDCYSGAAAAATRLVEAVTSLGIARADVRTSGLSLRSETVWREQSGQQVVAYVATAGLTVAVRELARAPELLDAVVRSGGEALRVHGLALEVSDAKQAGAAAQAAAFDDARDAAARLAAKAGRTLGEVVRIDAAPHVMPGPPIPMARVALASAVEAMPVEAGESEISSSVTVTWRLSD